MSETIFGKFDYLLPSPEELTAKDRSDLKAFRGQIAAGDLCRNKLFKDKGRRFTFPETFDLWTSYNWVGGVCGRVTTPCVRLVAIAEYLLGNVIEKLDLIQAPDEDVLRVVGELRRFHARKNGLHVRGAWIDEMIADEYCRLYDILKIREPILVATGIIPPGISKLDRGLAVKLANHELEPDFFALYPSTW